MSAETPINPMRKAHQAPRCTARSKRTGLPCRAPAVRGCRVCRMHGAWGGAPRGPRNGRYRSGLFTAEVVEATRLVRSFVRDARRKGE
jgi:hypothetical protein